jgi:hypothetical protein
MAKKQAHDRSKRRGPATFETVREIARGLPGAIEGPSYGTPGFRVAKRLFTRLHQDGVSLVVRMNADERAMRMRADPETFYITDHYRDYPWVLVRLSVVELDDLREVLEEAWRQRAPARLLEGREYTRRSSRGKGNPTSE